MKKKYWKNNGNSKNPSYDFTPPEFWGDDNLNLENEKIIHEIKNRETKNNPWIHEINKIPKILLSILISELDSGNSISSISNDDWPQNGSIVIKLNNRFKKENTNITGTNWRLLNDPHYCKEEISEVSEDVEFLLIN